MDPVEPIIEAFARGQMIIITDDDKRENEGDLVMAADKITPEAITFMAKQGSGLICLALSNAMADQLQLPLQQYGSHKSHLETAFTYSIDARFGITTGISAADRVKTIQDVVNPRACPSDIVIPGHIFPIRAKDGGILERNGHTEASVEMAMWANLSAAAVICEIMDDDGTMLRGDDLSAFAKKYDLPMISIEEMIAYRKSRNPDFKMQPINPLHIASECQLKTHYGEFRLVSFYCQKDAREHIALIKGDVRDHLPVRIHSECFTGDLLKSLHCDCGDQLNLALKIISEYPSGIFIYLQQEGRNIGLTNKIRAYHLQNQGLDTVDANLALGLPVDARDYAPAVAFLHYMKVKTLSLLTNNPSKIEALESAGFSVVRLPLLAEAHADNSEYLNTKKNRLRHLLEMQHES